MNSVKNLMKLSRHIELLRIILFLMFFTIPAQAQTSYNELDKDSENKTRLRLYGEVGLEYSDNIYHLTKDQITTIKENDPEDIASGRFTDMDSISDYIIKPRIGIKFDTDSPLGGDLRIISWFEYNFYSYNDESGFPEGEIKLINSAGKKGSLSLEGSFLSGFKKKNYLSGVNDINGNGNISKDERTYSPAEYDEYQGMLSYRHELIKEKDEIISGLNIRQFIGYTTRSYNSAFENRDRDIASAGLDLNMEFINKIDLVMTYEYERVSSTDNLELILFDESLSLFDVNGDGEIRRNAPLITNIDRSSRRHSIGINSSLKLTEDIKLSLEYSKRTTEYTSGNKLDIEHYNKKAHRKKFESEIGFDFWKSWNVKAAYSRTKEDDEEDGEYRENSYMFTLRYNF